MRRRTGDRARHPGTTELLRLYTGGTTGRPRGASLSQRAVTSAMAQIATGPHGGRPGERSLVVAPLSHAGAVWSALAPMAWGAGLVIAETTEPADLVGALDELRIGYAALVPALLGPMVDVPAPRVAPTRPCACCTPGRPRRGRGPCAARPRCSAARSCRATG